MNYTCGHKPWMGVCCVECRPDVFPAHVALTAPPAAAACEFCGGCSQVNSITPGCPPLPCPKCAAPAVKESLTTKRQTLSPGVDGPATKPYLPDCDILPPRTDNLANPSVLARGEEPAPNGLATPANQRGPGSLTVAGAIDWDAARYAAGDPIRIIAAATRNLKPVKVPTREELAVSIYGAVLAENGPSLVTRERLAAADAILALMEGK